MVSIILPYLNAEKYLEKCLDSVLAQTYTNFEVICVDNGSTDRSAEIIEEYRSKMKIELRSQSVPFAGSARNLGLAAAHGDYLFYLDADDECAPRLLEATVQKAEETRADIVIFDYLTFSAQTDRENHRAGCVASWLPKNADTFSRRELPKNICEIAFTAPWCKLYRRDFVAGNALTFDGIRTCNDLTFCAMSLLSAETIAYLPQTLYRYRVHHADTLSSFKKNTGDDVLSAVSSLASQAAQLAIFPSVRASVQSFCINKLVYSAANNFDVDHASLQNDFFTRCRALIANDPLFSDIGEDTLWGVSTYWDYLLFLSCDTYAHMDTVKKAYASFTKRQLDERKAFHAALRKKTEACDKAIQKQKERCRLLSESLQKQLDAEKQAYKAITDSSAYHAGLAITYIPRRLKRLLPKKPGS